LKPHDGLLSIICSDTKAIYTILQDVTAGLAVFGTKIVALRIGFAFTATILVGFMFNYVYYLFAFRSETKVSN